MPRSSALRNSSKSAPGMRVFALGPSEHVSLSLLKRVGFRSTPVAKADFRLAVDGGVDAWLKLKLPPHLAVGDWDSVKPATRKRLDDFPHLTLPREKDRSDLYHALRMARLIGGTELVAAGLTGGRADHALGVLLDFTHAAAELGFRRLRVIGADADYEWIRPEMGTCELDVIPGRVFSLFAVDGPAIGVSLEGAEFPLKGATLEPGSHGLSNCRNKAGSVRVRVKRGTVLVIVPRPIARS